MSNKIHVAKGSYELRSNKGWIYILCRYKLFSFLCTFDIETGTKITKLLSLGTVGPTYKMRFRFSFSLWPQDIFLRTRSSLHIAIDLLLSVLSGSPLLKMVTALAIFRNVWGKLASRHSFKSLVSAAAISLSTFLMMSVDMPKTWGDLESLKDSATRRHDGSRPSICWALFHLLAQQLRLCLTVDQD